MVKEKGIKGLLKRGFSDFQQLTRRSLITEKLIAINIFIYRFLVSIIISAALWINYPHIFFLWIFLIALLLSSLTLLIYVPIIEYIAEHARHLIEGIRASIILMFIDLTIAIAGLLFKNTILTITALIILVLQLIIILISNIKILTKPQFDTKAEPQEVWKYVGRIPLSCGIASLMADLILSIYYYAVIQPISL
jgi:hypothetical protein